MAEWLKASVLKTDSGYKLLVGSNPTLSVIFTIMKEKRKYEEI